MAKMNSAVKFNVDAEAQVSLRPEASVALAAAATVNETAVSLNELTSYWDTGIIPFESIAIQIFVNSLTTSGDATYNITLETASDAAGANNTTQHSVTITETGLYTLYVDVDTARKIDADASHIRLSSTIGGTSGFGLDYYAWMTPVVG